MSGKAEVFAVTVLLSLFMTVAFVASLVTGDWSLLLGCLIALGIAGALVGLVILVCVLAERLFPRL